MKVFTFYAIGTDAPLKAGIQIPFEQTRTFVPPEGFIINTYGWDCFIPDKAYYYGLAKDLPDDLKKIAVHWDASKDLTKMFKDLS